MATYATNVIGAYHIRLLSDVAEASGRCEQQPRPKRAIF